MTFEDLSTLDKIEVRVLHDDGTTTTPIGTWQQTADAFSGSTGSKTTNFNIGSSVDMENITVEVTVTNTAGLETTVMESYSPGAATNLNHTGQLNGSTTFQNMDPRIPRF